MSLPAPSRREIILAHVFCVYQQFAAIGVYFLAKKNLDLVNVYTFVLMRLMFVVPIVFLFAVVMTRSKAPFKLGRKVMIIIVGSGLLNILIAQTILYKGLSMSTATNASIINAPCTPLFTAFFSVLRGTDKMNVYKAFGFIASIAGALILLQVENFEFEGTTFGNLLIIISALCGALNSLVQKHVLEQGVHPLVAQSYICLIGATAYSIAYSPLGLFSPENWMMPSQVWVYATILGVCFTAIPWSLGMIALKNTSPMTTAVYVVLQPPISAFVEVVVLSGALTLRQVLGSGLVLLGLLFVNGTPLVQKFLAFVRRLFLSKQQREFELLSNAEDGKLEVELKEPDGADFAIVGETEYDLSIERETNDFIIPAEEKEEKPEEDVKKAGDVQKKEKTEEWKTVALSVQHGELRT